MAELTAFGPRLLILQCSEALLIGSPIHSDFIPVHKKTGFCCNFHVTVHTCAILGVTTPVRCGPAVCSRHPAFSTAPLWGSYFLYLLQECGWDLAWLFNQRVLRCTVTSTMKGAGTYFEDLHGHEWVVYGGHRTGTAQGSQPWEPQRWWDTRWIMVLS